MLFHYSEIKDVQEKIVLATINRPVTLAVELLHRDVLWIPNCSVLQESIPKLHNDNNPKPWLETMPNQHEFREPSKRGWQKFQAI